MSSRGRSGTERQVYRTYDTKGRCCELPKDEIPGQCGLGWGNLPPILCSNKLVIQRSANWISSTVFTRATTEAQTAEPRKLDNIRPARPNPTCHSAVPLPKALCSSHLLCCAPLVIPAGQMVTPSKLHGSPVYSRVGASMQAPLPHPQRTRNRGKDDVRMPIP